MENDWRDYLFLGFLFVLFSAFLIGIITGGIKMVPHDIPNTQSSRCQRYGAVDALPRLYRSNQELFASRE